MKRVAMAALALLASQVALSDSPGARADAIVRSTMHTHQIPGVVLGVVRDGHLIKATGYG
jgi:CubicO group peptidase (beta-lactamase class C family)